MDEVDGGPETKQNFNSLFDRLRGRVQLGRLLGGSGGGNK